MDCRELIKQIAAGDKEALKQFFSEYGGKILHAAERVLCDRQKAEDVLNEVLLKVWQSADKLLNMENIVGYVCAMAYNRAIDEKRKMRREVFDDQAADKILNILDTSEKLDVDSILEKMEEPYRSVLILKGSAGLSFISIARDKKIPYHTVRRIYAEACRMFKEMYLDKK